MDKAYLDKELAELQGHKARWARLPVRDKIRYLAEVRGLAVEHAQAWVSAGAQLKGFRPDSPLLGSEEWLSGPYPTVSWLTEVMHTLEALRDGRDPLAGIDVTTTANGQVKARVLPANLYDRLLLNGYELDVWMQPGVSPETLSDTVGSCYRREDPSGRVTLVLGAGNVSAIPILDTLYSLIADGDVVILKMNPVNEVYGRIFERILEPLIRDGYARLCYGGADIGEYLSHHDDVEAIHITGSERTYNAIVFGTGRAGERARKAGTPVLTKPVRAELGGVGPTIVVPGPWSHGDLAYQAEHLATQKLHTSGHTCVASQVLVLPQQWQHTGTLVDELRSALAQSPQRYSFYPGADAMVERFRAENPDAEHYDGAMQERTLLVGTDANADHPAFTTELFGPVYVTTTLPGDDPETFLRNAVAFANDRLHGNLGVNILIHPDTARELGPVLEEALADLRYGCIGINTWSAFVFLASRGAWGAYPGNTPGDIQSGTGVVHNALLFDKPQKNVVTSPFRPFPRSARHLEPSLAVKPPWFVSNRTALSTAKQFTYFAADPKPQRLAGLFASALRG